MKPPKPPKPPKPHFRKDVLDRLARIEQKLDAIVVQGPALEALRAEVLQTQQRLAGSEAALRDATTTNQPKE